MAAKNYYEVLGIQKSATKDEIKKAFHKLAHKLHPDKATGDADKFKEVSEAYSILSDEKKRAEYDSYGRVFGGGGGPGAGGFNAGGFDFSQFQSQRITSTILKVKNGTYPLYLLFNNFLLLLSLSVFICSKFQYL